MIIIKTQLDDIPTTCKECKYHIIGILGDIGCPLLKDWITREEYKTNKKLKDCPLKCINVNTLK